MVKADFVCWCFRTIRVAARCVTYVTRVFSWRVISSRGPTHRMREVISAISSVFAVSTTLSSRMATSLKEDLSVLRRTPLGGQTVQLLLPETMSFVHPIGLRPENSYLRLHRGRHGFDV